MKTTSPVLKPVRVPVHQKARPQPPKKDKATLFSFYFLMGVLALGLLYFLFLPFLI